MVENLIVGFILGTIKVLVSLLFSVASVYFAIRVFDSITSEIDEWREIRRGNIAVSIYFGAVIFTFSLIIAPSLQDIYSDVSSLTDSFSVAMLVLLGLDLVELILTIIIASIALYLTLLMIDAFSHNMRKFQQLKQGNIAVAITMSAILLGVGIIIREGVLSLASLLNPMNILVGPI